MGQSKRVVPTSLEIEFGSENVGYASNLSSIYKTMNGGGIVNISEYEKDNQFCVFPNPARDYISISGLDQKIENIEILDLTGKTVLGPIRNIEIINLSGIARGTYILKVKTDKTSMMKKLVLE